MTDRAKHNRGRATVARAVPEPQRQAAGGGGVFSTSLLRGPADALALQRLVGNRATGQLLAGHGLLIQRQILLGKQPLDAEKALALLVELRPEVFKSQGLVDHTGDYLAILATLVEEHRAFDTPEQLVNTVERIRRDNLRQQGGKSDPLSASSSKGMQLEDQGSEKSQSASSVQIKIEQDEDELVNYDAPMIQQYRLAMAHGRAWGSEAEATVVAESLGVRFRIYHFANEDDTVPQYNIEVGSSGPLYALHYDPTPGHYSLLIPDPQGAYLLHGVRYRFGAIAKDGHCLFSAGFQAVNGRKPTADDIYGLRAVAASMVPDEVIHQMLVEIGASGAKSSKSEDHKQDDSEDDNKSNDVSMASSSNQQSGVAQLQPFMSRINYLLNRYPNLFYVLRTQHSDFGNLFGGFSETRLAFFYNDMLVPKQPVAQQDEVPELDFSALPEPKDFFELEEQLSQVIAHAQQKLKQYRQKRAEISYQLMMPEEMEQLEKLFAEAMSHHTLRDEVELDPEKFLPKQGSSSQVNPEDIIRTLLTFEDQGNVKEVLKNYIYSSNDPDKEHFHKQENRNKQEQEMSNLRKDKLLAPLRKNKLKTKDAQGHAEQLMLAGGPWEAVTTVALEQAFNEATRETIGTTVYLDPELIETPHTFTVVINRAACPSCTDALIAGIRLFWRTCEEMFGLKAGQGREVLGHIFRFELSVTGMYAASQASESTTEQDLKALQASGWEIGLHHEKSGGLAPLGYAMVEAMHGKHSKEAIDKLAGRGRASEQAIGMSDKLELGRVRKLRKIAIVHRPPAQHKNDSVALRKLLETKKSARNMIAAAQGFLEQAAEELGNYPALDSEGFAEEAQKLLDEQLKGCNVYGNKQLPALIDYIVTILDALYNLLEKLRTDK